MHSSSLGVAPPSATRTVVAALLVWFLVVVALAATGAMTIERRALVPLAILGQATAFVVLYRRRGSLHGLAQSIDVRVPILFHALRGPIGVGFLVLAAHGRLDPVFAGIAGWGDLVVGVLALVVALGGARPGRGWTRLRRAWNLLGLVDILVVLGTAQSILFVSDHPETMAGLLTFPWPLVPLAVVPLVLATHLLLIVRLRV